MLNHCVLKQNSAPHVVGRRGEQAVALRMIASQEPKLVSMELKTLSMITKAFITSTTALFKVLFFSSSVPPGPFTRWLPSLLKNCIATGSGQIYLGRAWGDYSRVIFSYTYMDNIVLPKGWSDWGDQKRDSRVYYGEYKCSGPGANLAGSVPWARVLTDEEAKPFIGMQFIERDTWLASP
ncbi:putative pectinesterase 53 [Glycine soja]|uniref:pectinesterase n=1 Tax=Glycine soja TaxID=3848 RepID=A0A445LI18_GLYSO|nr:putative pectinesterase 53 [Glycine soja]